MTTPDEQFTSMLQAAPDRFAAVRTAANDLGLRHRVDTTAAARLLAVLVRSTRAAYILELGAATGYLTLHIADSLGRTGYIEAVEPDTQAADIASTYIQRYGFADRIRVRNGDVVPSIRGTNGPFDLIVLASPGQTFPALLDEFVRVVRVGGTVLALGLDTATAPEDAAGVTRLLERLESDRRFLLTVPTGAGWALALRVE